MKLKLVSTFIAALSVAVASHAARPVEPQPTESTGYLGVTSVSFDGSAGLADLYAACQSDFGAGAKVCNTQQLLESPNIAGQSPGSVGAWVRPSVVGYDGVGVAADYSSRIFSTTSVSSAASCGGSTDIDSKGLIVDSKFFVRTERCDVARPAVCCR